MSQSWHLDVDGAIARLVIDVPDRPINAFSRAVIDELDALLDEIAGRSELRTLVLCSGKPDMFIAGADITELQAIAEREQALAASRGGQRVFQKLADLPQCTIAVIDGPCLGGGCECALACDFRIATDNRKCQIGLPEVQLGIIPGWGGTQRLPRCIGLAKAAPLILSGKPVDGRKAQKLGLVDGYLATAFLEQGVQRFISALDDKRKRTALIARRRSRGSRMLEALPGVRGYMLSKAERSVRDKGGEHYPAPLAAVAAMREGLGTDLAEGLEREAEHFAAVALTPEAQNLTALFFAMEALKKGARKAGEQARPVQRAGVLGAGVMGGGIGWLFSKNDIPVYLKDIAWDAIAKGYAAARDIYAQLEKIRKLRRWQVARAMHHISGGLDPRGLARSDVVVEAVVEDLDIKRTVLQETEKVVGESCVLATNTSSLTVAELADGLQRPENFVGMHFFNPVNRMPLVEVVAGAQSSPEAVATVHALAFRLGKTPVVVGDCPGFLVNRILLPYLNEAAWIMQDGVDPERIDRLARDWGLPMGPFRLMDEIGIDVGYKVARILERGHGERMTVAPLLVQVAEMDLLGKKGKRGFYRYDGKRAQANPQVGKLVPAGGDLDDTTIVDRLVLIMVNEATRCLHEGIVQNAADCDMAMILGTGFPPFRGGLLRHADERGLAAVVERLDAFADAHGERFRPCEPLRQRASDDRCFRAQPAGHQGRDDTKSTKETS